MNIVVLGAPGAGKGTQSKYVAQRIGNLHISTGDLLRKEVEEQSEFGKIAMGKMSDGDYVCDEIVTILLKQKLDLHEDYNGFVLDGYPRNISQAKELLTFVDKVDKVIVIHVEDSTIIERMGGRVVCAECGQVFHTQYNPPTTQGKCDKCGNDLIQREDDKPHVVKKRLEKYHQLTTPIINYYKELGLIKTVSGLGKIEDVTNSIMEALEVEEIMIK